MNKRAAKIGIWAISNIVFIVAFLFLTPCAFIRADSKADVNVLLISIDTIRPDRLSCYSKKHLETPAIDSLARRGALFERAFAHVPLTLPSHANMLLGVTPLFHGIHENKFGVVADDFLTLTEHLKAHGFATGAFIGAFPMDSRFGLAQGFDVYDESYSTFPSALFVFPERKAEEVLSSAKAWLEKQDRKWFAMIHLFDPHAPYLPPESFMREHKDDLYTGEVDYVDTELGKFFRFLEEKGFADNTYIILTGDHGESLGDHGEPTHGYFAYNSTLWVPLIMVGPGIKAGRISEYVAHSDLFPTLCDLLGIEKPSSLQGVSLLPLLKGKRIKERAIYIETLLANLYNAWAPLRGYIEKGKKFIDLPIPEYYDLEKDFNEENNLMERFQLAEFQKRLKNLEEELTLIEKPKVEPQIDRESLEKLKSLGYLASLVPQTKEQFGPEEDLKTLLPVRSKQFRALTLFWEGKHEQSAQLFTQIIQEKPNLVQSYVQLSQIYEAQARGDEAIHVLEEGVRLNPDNYEILSKFGISLIKYGRLDQGIDVCRRSLAMIDYDPDVWSHLGVAYWRKGDFQKAQEYYLKALSLDKDNAGVFSNLGMLHLSLFKQDKKRADHLQASEYFKKAIERDPTLASAYNGLGDTYNVIGQTDAAITLWEKTIDLDPDMDPAVYNLGLAHFEKGDKTRALPYLERYLELRKNTLTPGEIRRVQDLIALCKK